MVYIYEDGTLLEEWEIPLNPPIEIREDVMVFANLTNKQKISNLKLLLDKTDYIANKLAEAIAEYIITEDKTKIIELQTEYEKELFDRETWRKEVNKLENY